MILLFGILALVASCCGQLPAQCYTCGQQAAITGCTANCPPPQPPRPAELKCEEGYVLRNGFCEQKTDIRCPAGSTLQGGHCVIVRTENAICPVGSEMRDGQCVKIFERVCPYGYHMMNGQCIRSETVPVSCPPGSYLQNNECIRIECPKDYRLENGWCVQINPPPTPPCEFSCPTGYILQNNLCYPRQPTPVPQPPVPPSCPLAPPVVVTPAPQVECTAGYILRNKECIREEIECPEGTTYRGGKCERIACPPPSVWNGQYCVHYITQQGATNNTNLVNNTHTVHNFNNVTHDTNVNVNNVNNVYIYKGGEVVHVTNGTQVPPPPPPPSRLQPEPEPEPEVIPSPPCCTVVTPRICKHSQSRWRCFNRKYHRCGSFCTRPIIQLRPTQPVLQHQVLVMPPTPPVMPNCGPSGCSGQVNCSGCQTGGYCSPSCYEYSCGEDCMYQEQQAFCQDFAGPGCGVQDGCYI